MQQKMANGTTSRCEAFLAVENVMCDRLRYIGKKLEVDRGAGVRNE